MADFLAGVEVTHLTKTYGDRTVLNDLTFSVSPGEALLVVGPPGSGKSTLARILATAEAPTHGAVRILGQHTRRRPMEARAQLGYMPAAGALDPELTVEEYLEFFLRAYDRDDLDGWAALADVLELADLTARKQELVGTLRPADGRKLSLARCLLHDPRVLILDEPLAELNAGGREEVHAVLQTLRDMGKCLVVCTRSIESMRNLANEFCVLDRGRASEIGSEADLRQWHAPRALYDLRVEGDVRRAARILVRAGGLVLQQRKDHLRVALDDPAQLRDIAGAFAQAGLRVHHRQVEPEMTDVIATCFARRAQAERATQDFLREERP